MMQPEIQHIHWHTCDTTHLSSHNFDVRQKIAEKNILVLLVLVYETVYQPGWQQEVTVLTVCSAKLILSA